MNELGKPPLHRLGKWPSLVLGTNLALGLALCLGCLTDYSWTHLVLDLTIPWAVPVVGVASLAFLILKGRLSQVNALAFFPSWIGTVLYIFTLPALLETILLNSSPPQLIQKSLSPDGQWTAEAFFRPLGALGDDQFYVRVQHRMLPFLERHVCFRYNHYCSEDCLSWDGNHTLHIFDTQRKIKQTVRIGAVGPAVDIDQVLLSYDGETGFCITPFLILPVALSLSGTCLLAPQVLRLLRKHSHRH